MSEISRAESPGSMTIKPGQAEHCRNLTPRQQQAHAASAGSFEHDVKTQTAESLNKLSKSERNRERKEEKIRVKKICFSLKSRNNESREKSSRLDARRKSTTQISY